MQKMEDQIKGLEYLSDDAKKRVLEARGIDTPEPTPRAQHKIEREDARKAEEKAYIAKEEAINRVYDMRHPCNPATSAMKLHIDIHAYGKNGDAFHLGGDVYNTEDLAAIHDRFQGYMPRRKLWGVL